MGTLQNSSDDAAMIDEGKKPLPGDENDLSKADGFGRADGSALLQDAMVAMRKLKRKHRSSFDADPKRFRRLIDKAKSRVLTLQRGPKPDRTISLSAREVAAGSSVEKAFQKRYPFALRKVNENL